MVHSPEIEKITSVDERILPRRYKKGQSRCCMKFHSFSHESRGWWGPQTSYRLTFSQKKKSSISIHLSTACSATSQLRTEKMKIIVYNIKQINNELMCEAGNEKIYEKKFLRDLEQLWPVIYCESMWHRRILEPPNSVESNVKWCEIVFRFPNETNETSPEKIFRPFSCFLCAREEILNVQLQLKKHFFSFSSSFIFHIIHALSVDHISSAEHACAKLFDVMRTTWVQKKSRFEIRTEKITHFHRVDIRRVADADGTTSSCAFFTQKSSMSLCSE